MVDKEEWAALNEFPDYFEISNYGRVKSRARVVNRKSKGNVYKPERVLKSKIDKDGYKCIGLRINGERYWRRINILVALAFVPNPNNYPIAGHIDNDKANNYYKNLIWCTISQNTKYAYECGRKITWAKPIYKCSIDNKIIKKYDSVAETQKDGFSPKNVSQVLVGDKKTHRGYKFIYA